MTGEVEEQLPQDTDEEDEGVNNDDYSYSSYPLPGTVIPQYQNTVDVRNPNVWFGKPNQI